MTNVKCIRCGVVNAGTDHVCKACAIELNPIAPPLIRSTLFPFDQPHTGLQYSGISSQLIGPFHGVGDVLGPTLRLFAKNIWLITKIVFVIVVPFEVFKAMTFVDAGDWQLSGGMFALEMLCNVLIAPAMIYALMKVMETGTAPSVSQAYRWGSTKLGKLIICAVIAGALQALGLAFCVVPGIIIGVALQLVYPLAILENGSVSEVLLDSKELTKEHRGNIFFAMLVMWLMLMVASLPVWALAQYFGLLEIAFWPLHLGAAIGYDILEQATTVLSLVIYLSIRRTLASGDQVIQ
jgi:hypothetical protein